MDRLRGQYSLIAAGTAGLCWAAVLTLLLFGGLNPHESPVSLQRLIYYLLVVGAGLLTFAPLEYNLGLRWLTIEGLIGGCMLFYGLAFIPAPTDWLIALPDLPVYMWIIIALFFCGAAVTRPFLYVLGQRIFKQRARALDQRRVRRQSYEIGLLLSALAALAGLRVLTWVSILLLGLALVIAELLFLSQVKAEV